MSHLFRFDAELVHLPMFVLTWATFFLAALLSFFLQLRISGKFSAASLLTAYFPPSGWMKRSAKIDVMTYVIVKLYDRYAIGLAWTAITSGLMVRLLTQAWPHHEVYKAGYPAIIFCSIVIFLISDFTNYVTHYLQHYVPMLWELHKVHHSATFLNPLTSQREHPLGMSFDGINNAVTVGMAAGILSFMFGFSLVQIVFLLASADKIGSIVVSNALKHSHFSIGYGALETILLSPRMHQLHHSCKPEHWDRNFGNKLSLWDVLFGTAYMPRPRETIELGLGTAEDSDYDYLWGVYAGPLVKIARLVAARRRSASTWPRRYTTGLLWRSQPASESQVSSLTPAETIGMEF